MYCNLQLKQEQGNGAEIFIGWVLWFLMPISFCSEWSGPISISNAHV
jgi:hypothetical protein